MRLNKYAAALGRRGGRSRSEAKRRAAQDNLARARKTRWPKKNK